MWTGWRDGVRAIGWSIDRRSVNGRCVVWQLRVMWTRSIVRTITFCCSRVSKHAVVTDDKLRAVNVRAELAMTEWWTSGEAVAVGVGSGRWWGLRSEFGDHG